MVIDGAERSLCMILVVGGAGYIGSHVVKQLVETNSVVVLDNLSTGHRYLVDKRAVFVHGDLGDRAALVRIFEKYPIDAVMHFAANSLVGESVVDPMKYYKNNVAATLTLLETMMEYGVKRFIFHRQLRCMAFRTSISLQNNVRRFQLIRTVARS